MTMSNVEGGVLFAAGSLILVAAVLLLIFAIYWAARSVTSIASARINLVEAREREAPAEEEPEQRQSIVGERHIPTRAELERALLLEKLERGELNASDLAGLPADDELLHAGAFVRGGDRT